MQFSYLAIKLPNFKPVDEKLPKLEPRVSHNIIDIIETIQQNMDNKLFSCAVFIDLKKAFDTVDHSMLLKKLSCYGIRGITNNWFESYLLNRTQSIEINGFKSSKDPNPYGVPQGSVLGPLLFLIYINDITKASSKLRFFLFADDTNLLYANKNLKTLENTVNTELIKLCDWLTANKLTLNIKKSNFVLFRTCQKRITTPVNIRLFDNDAGQYVDLDNKECVKYLGVLIDSHLSWRNHIDYISTKLSKTIGLFAKLRHSSSSTYTNNFILVTYTSIPKLWYYCLGTSLQNTP